MDDERKSERTGGTGPQPSLRRMAGRDMRVDHPVYVPLELELVVSVSADHFRSEVRSALLEVLGSGRLPDGRRGMFHPDNLGFGQTVCLSSVYAAAHCVPGVEFVEVKRFHRQGGDDTKPPAEGSLVPGPREIARLDNDPRFPERGVLRLELHGGM